MNRTLRGMVTEKRGLPRHTAPAGTYIHVRWGRESPVPLALTVLDWSEVGLGAFRPGQDLSLKVGDVIAYATLSSLERSGQLRELRVKSVEREARGGIIGVRLGLSNNHTWWVAAQTLPPAAQSEPITAEAHSPRLATG